MAGQTRYGCARFVISLAPVIASAAGFAPLAGCSEEDHQSNFTGTSNGESFNAGGLKFAARGTPQQFKRGDVIYACLAGKDKNGNADRFPDKLWVHPTEQILYIQSPGEKPFRIEIHNAEFVRGVVCDVIPGGQCEFSFIIKKNQGTSSVYELHVYREYVPRIATPVDPPAFEPATTSPIVLASETEPTSIDPADIEDDKDLDLTALFVRTERAGAPAQRVVESVVLSRRKGGNAWDQMAPEKAGPLDAKPDPVPKADTKDGGIVTMLSHTPGPLSDVAPAQKETGGSTSK